MITSVGKSVNPCPDLVKSRPVSRGAGNKKPLLITVGVSYLVEAAGIEPASKISLIKVIHKFGPFILHIQPSGGSLFHIAHYRITMGGLIFTTCLLFCSNWIDGFERPPD